MRRDAEDYVVECILCPLSKSGSKIPRPLALTLHGERSNQVIHFDYLFVGSSTAGKMYTLIVKDDIRGYCWLEPFIHATAAHAAQILARWIRKVSPPEFWVSDQGSHFINYVIRLLADAYHLKHCPTVAYCPWANCTVERLSRDVLGVYLLNSAWRGRIGYLLSALCKVLSISFPDHV